MKNKAHIGHVLVACLVSMVILTYICKDIFIQIALSCSDVWQPCHLDFTGKLWFVLELKLKTKGDDMEAVGIVTMNII